MMVRLVTEMWLSGTQSSSFQAYLNAGFQGLVVICCREPVVTSREEGTRTIIPHTVLRTGRVVVEARGGGPLGTLSNLRIQYGIFGRIVKQPTMSDGCNHTCFLGLPPKSPTVSFRLLWTFSGLRHQQHLPYEAGRWLDCPEVAKTMGHCTTK